MIGRVAVVGGTGNLGAAMARSLARAGVSVAIGSRSAASAQAAAAELSEEIGVPIESGANREVAASADIVLVTVPFAAQTGTLEDIRDVVQGKIVVDATVPLVPPKVMRVQLPAAGSAAQAAQALLGEGVTVVSAFHNVAAHRLATGEPVDCDVLVFSDDVAARGIIVALAERIGLRGVAGGALANSAAAEALTSVLIFINKTYKVDGAGIRLTGISAAR